MNYLRTCCLLLILGSISCHNTKTVIPEEAQQFALLPDSVLAAYKGLTILYDKSGNCFFSLYDRDRHSMVFFNGAGKETKRIPLQLPDSLTQKGPGIYIQSLNEDSTVVVFSENPTVYFFNRKGEMAGKINISASLTDGVSDYALPGMAQSPYLFFNHHMLVTCARLDVVVRTAKARIKYFSTPPYMSVSTTETKDQSNVGCWPMEYRSGVSYRDFYPQNCLNNKNQVVFGFAASDSLYVMENGRIISAHLCRSKFMSERHAYPDDSLGHFSFLERFDINEPRYRFLIYDPYRNYYYRVVHHAQEYEQQGGMMVNGYLDKPWSLMILDENFNVLSETIFDKDRFLPCIFPVKEGILVQHRKDPNRPPPLTFTLFKLKE